MPAGQRGSPSKAKARVPLKGTLPVSNKDFFWINWYYCGQITRNSGLWAQKRYKPIPILFYSCNRETEKPSRVTILFTAPKMYLYPIPYKETAGNPSVTQNPGWE
jgi:hypothetical protein